MVPVNCSHCGKQTQVEPVFRINPIEEPALKSKLKDGSLFVWECPYCGTRNLLTTNTVYHDPEARVMILLLKEADGRLEEILAKSAGDIEGYTLRRVDSVGDLIEKVNLLDAGLEDTVMEMCKWVTRRELGGKNPGIQEAPLHFLRMEGPDNDLVLAFPLNGQMHVVNIGFNVYEDARGILARNPSVQPGPGFAQVDAAWLERFFR